MHQWTATDPGRLDVFLAKQDSGISRVKARNSVKEGQVLVNGRIARKPAMMVAAGDVVQMSLSGEPVSETRMKAMDLTLHVLYEDAACMVIDKPAGIPVHPGAGIPKDAQTILHGIVHLFAERKIPFSSSAVLVHRLDKDTTGCLLVAKSAEYHKELQMQFEHRTVKKMYLALVAGVPDPPAAMIDASIGRSTANRTKMTLLGSGKTREARTTYRTLASSVTNHAALISCELHTGRTHQIRVHLQGVGHPLLGDPTYKTSMSEEIAEKIGITAICLHAWKLSFVSPADMKEHAVTSPLPTWMEKDVKALGMKWG